jgi:phosphoribosylaminoimidazole carboxylase (NCAIR synthetase)
VLTVIGTFGQTYTYLCPMQKSAFLGGQLGRMFLLAAANYPVETFVLENDPACPAAHLCHHFICGDIKNFDAVYNFGKGLNAITIEIENVNVDALEKLENEGVKVFHGHMFKNDPKQDPSETVLSAT